VNKEIYKVNLNFRNLTNQKTAMLPCIAKMQEGYQAGERAEWCVSFNHSILGEPCKDLEKSILNSLLSSAARTFAGFEDSDDLYCFSELIFSGDGKGNGGAK
jgi:hypothetical protein